jgi:hypothetical protein
METTHGLIYVLTNECMPGLVKIGMTTQSIKDRMNNLYGTGVPVQFECAFAFRVPVDDVRKVEKIVHSRYKKERKNPHREFFMIDDLDDLLSWLRDLCDAFHLQEEVTDEVNTELNHVSFADKAYEEEVALEKKSRAKNFTFPGLGIAPGTTLYYVNDKSITCVVYDDRKVSYNGEVLSLSNVSKQLVGNIVRPTYYWAIEDGTTLFDLYEKL